MELTNNYPQGEVPPQGDIEALQAMNGKIDLLSRDLEMIRRIKARQKLASTAIDTFDDNPCVVRGEE